MCMRPCVHGRCLYVCLSVCMLAVSCACECVRCMNECNACVLYVCVCVCMQAVGVFLCIHVYVCVSLWANERVCVFACIVSVCSCVYMCICVCVCVAYVCMCVNTCSVCVCVYVSEAVFMCVHLSDSACDLGRVSLCLDCSPHHYTRCEDYMTSASWYTLVCSAFLLGLRWAQSSSSSS